MGSSLSKRTEAAKGYAKEDGFPSSSRITIVFSKNPSDKKVDKTVIYYNGNLYEDEEWVTKISRYSRVGKMLHDSLAVHSTPPTLSLMQWLKSTPNEIRDHVCDSPEPHLVRFVISF